MVKKIPDLPDTRPKDIRGYLDPYQVDKDFFRVDNWQIVCRELLDRIEKLEKENKDIRTDLAHKKDIGL